MAMHGQSSHAPLASLAVHWHACKGDIPPPLVGASVTLVDDGSDSPSSSSSPSLGKVYLFGGRLVTTRRMINDMYVLDLSTLYWTRHPSTIDIADGSFSIPQPRYFHSCDLWNGKLIIFGGMGYGTENESELCVLDEIVAFDLKTQQWDLNFGSNDESSHQSDLSPEPRYAHLSSITADSLVIIGGQDMSNHYIESVNVFDLRKRAWVTSQAFEKQRGSYRSLAVGPRFVVDEHRTDTLSHHQSVKNPNVSSPLAPSNINLLPTSRKAVDQKGKEVRLPIYIYTNYNFTDVKREMETIKIVEPDGGNGNKEEVELVTIEDQFGPMNGISLPPGLRFPMGAILGNHLLISGTYLANTSQTFAIWALYLPKMTWSRLDVGSLFASGSWNRGVLWPSQGRLLVFGHRDRDLVSDYNHRQTNWDHVFVIELEAWGITQPPLQIVPRTSIDFGIRKLASSVLGTLTHSISNQIQPSTLSFGGRGDFEIVCSDGIRLGCDRAILERRWPWFAERMQDYKITVQLEAQKLIKSETLTEKMKVLILEDDKGESEESSSSTRLGKSEPRLTPRQLFIAEPSPVVLSLLIFFYTRTICTTVQRHPTVVASLLIISRIYRLSDLENWAKHAAQVALATDLAAPSGFDGNTPVTSSPISSGCLFSLPPLERHRLAVAIYEAATLCGLEALQIRALRTVMAVAKWVQRASTYSATSANDVDSPTNAMNLTPTTAALWREGSNGFPSENTSRSSPSNTRLGSPASRKRSSMRRMSGDSYEVEDTQPVVARRPSKAERMLGMSGMDSPSTTPTTSNTINRVSKAEKMLGITSGENGAGRSSRKGSLGSNRSASHSLLQGTNIPQPPLTLRRPSVPNSSTNQISLTPRSSLPSTDYGSSTNTNTSASSRKRFSIFGRSTDLGKMSGSERLGSTPDLLEEHEQSIYRSNVTSDGRVPTLQRTLSSNGPSSANTSSSNVLGEGDIKRTELGKASGLTRLKAPALQPIDTSR